MTQLDWEKMKEEVRIHNVEAVTINSWVSVQNEYTINPGMLINGTYLDTQTDDANFESFSESTVGASNLSLIEVESFEGNWPPDNWSETGNWNKENNYAYSGEYSADFDGTTGGTSGYLNSPTMDCSDAQSIYVEFWWHDRGLDDGDIFLEYYDGNIWVNYQDLNTLDSDNGWHHYAEMIVDNRYLISNFQIRWWVNNMWDGENVCVDIVVIKKGLTSNNCLDINGTFSIDIPPNQLEYIDSVEIQVKYRTDDNAEKWYLKTYNWETFAYSNSGFNSTLGHTPITGWNYYAVNLMDMWPSYIDSNGTIKVKFVDQVGDNNQTILDIAFFGLRVKMAGTEFTFKNNGALTLHLVSLWIINSTHHQRYDIEVFVNSAATRNLIHYGVSIPPGNYSVRVITERGNIAVFSEN